MSDSEDTYSSSHPTRGLAVIINNDKFQKEGEAESVRAGSSCDAQALEIMFKKLAFTVYRYDNIEGKEIFEILKEIATSKMYDHSKADCFACALLTHGTAAEYDRNKLEDFVFGTNLKAVPVSLIIDLFRDDNCPELTGKPRIFFIQACRGDKSDDGVDVSVLRLNPSWEAHKDHGDDHNDAVGHTKTGDTGSSSDDPGTNAPVEDTNIPNRSSLSVYPSPIYKDMLMMSAAPIGYSAYRRETGSWFIQSLCAVLTSHDVSRIPLTKLLTIVTKRVALEYQYVNKERTDLDGKKQVPCLMSMLTKDVYLSPKHVIV